MIVGHSTEAKRRVVRGGAVYPDGLAWQWVLLPSGVRSTTARPSARISPVRPRGRHRPELRPWALARG